MKYSKSIIEKIINDYESEYGVDFQKLKEVYETLIKSSVEELDIIGFDNFTKICKMYSHSIPGRYRIKKDEKEITFEVVKSEDDKSVSIKIIKTE